DSKLELSRLGLRPYATWHAYRKVAGSSGEAAVLVVSLAGESLELTVARGESVLFSRATLLRAAVDSKSTAFTPASALLGEVRRPLAAFSNQVPGVEVERLAVAAGSDEQQALIAALAANLPIPVDRFDPFQAVDIPPDLSATLPEQNDSRGAFV